MKEIIGEYNSSLKKLYDSFKKRFGLSHLDTLEYVDKMIDDKEYAVLFFSSDITFSRELIDEINSTGVGQAYGFYKDGPISSTEEIREAVPRIIGDGGNKFIFVELEDRSRFRIEEIPKTVFVKLKRDKGDLAIDIVKSRVYLKDEIIRKIEKDDTEEFNKLYNKLYMGRWENRSDIFVRNFKMINSELSKVCGRSFDMGVFVCYREDKLVGFVVYEFVNEKDGRAFEDRYYLTVRDIYVVPEFRRMGIATRLFREVQRLADKNKLKYVRFKSWAFDEEMRQFINSLDKNELYAMYEVKI